MPRFCSRAGFFLKAVLLTAGFFLAGVSAHAAPSPILDKQKQLDRFTFWDNKDWSWYRANIPFFESPDKAIDETYYYRWELTTKHMTYGSPQSGYSFTEFINRPGWSGAYGSISCPMGLQLEELRWLKDKRVVDDYIRYWFDTPGAQPRSYSNWYGTAVWENYLVDSNRALLLGRLPSMEAQYQGWLAEHWNPSHQMFHWSGMHDGMEFTIGSRQTQDEFAGGDSYRPTLNSYVYGDLIALAKTAALAGDTAKAARYRQKASALKQRVQDELWDPKRKFFLSQFAYDEQKGGYTIKANTRMYEDGQYAGDPHGRELSGYIPWQFHLPDAGKGYEAAWKGVANPDVFLAPYGLYFTEVHDPLFLCAQSSCVWSGNNWPYADSQVLTAMANVLNDYPQKVLTKADYFQVLSAYTAGQRKDGRPYIAETSDPTTGKWTQDTPNASEHYFHSSYANLIITGLVGLRPRADNTVEVHPLIPDTWRYFALDDAAYHGHTLSIVWDRDGTRYRRGRGLTIFADGKRIANSATLGKLEGALPAAAPVKAKIDRPVNFAVNNDGRYYPRIRASYTAPETSVANLTDGSFYYHQLRPINRWTTASSPDTADSVTVDFGMARPVESVKLYLLDDGPGKDGTQAVQAPEAIALEFWDGTLWKPVPGQKRSPAAPEGHRPNVIAFPKLSTSRLRVTLTPQAGAAAGMTELEAWGHAPLPLPKVSLNNLARDAKASASYTSKFDAVNEINDGQIVMNGGRNRWTAYDSPSSTDWVQLDFPKPVTVRRMELCLWADGGGVKLPKRYSLQYWNGTDWLPVEEIRRDPAAPALLVPNEIVIDPVRTDRLRATFVHDSPSASGLTEWLVWGEGR